MEKLQQIFQQRLNICKIALLYMKNLNGNFGDISNIKSYDELPEKAKIYLSRIEEVVGSPIKFIGTGARKRKSDCEIK